MPSAAAVWAWRRKQVTLPNGEPSTPQPWDTAATVLQLALARGHRWLTMLESGEAKSLREIASLKGVVSVKFALCWRERRVYDLAPRTPPGRYCDI